MNVIRELTEIPAAEVDGEVGRGVGIHCKHDICETIEGIGGENVSKRVLLTWHETVLLPSPKGTTPQ